MAAKQEKRAILEDVTQESEENLSMLSVGSIEGSAAAGADLGEHAATPHEQRTDSAGKVNSGTQSDTHFSLRSLRAEAEIYALSKTLEYTGWNRRRAAQLLSISYRGILYKIRQHNLTPRGIPAPVAQHVNEAAKAE